ncbi:NADH dehydrogenase [Deltaproteobacteria bacterium]|nr:NADH dehydrogenase [Deltaproteobacteria bacterium]
MEKRFLLDALHEISEAQGYIGSDDLKGIASRFNLSMGQLFSEMTWYDAFSIEKPGAFVLRICDGTVCHARGNGTLLSEIEDLLHIKNGETTPDGRFTLHSVRCLGACENAPVMTAGGRIFHTGNAAAGRIVSALAADASPNLPDVSETMHILDAGFEPLLLREAKLLSSYLEQNGFEGLRKAVKLPARLDVIREVGVSGLRGRSGSAYPVGAKWKAAFNAPGREDNPFDKYIILNGDEGDPGAFMDRWLMEHNPYAVLEGTIIAAYAVRATKGVIYIRSEYPAAADSMRQAVNALRREGILGENILGSGFNFDCDVIRGAESYLCGEESALMESVEGLPGIPRLRPPYPTFRGLYNQPTIINNVETMANIPAILRNGGAAYAQIGKASCTGVKLLSLSGSVKNKGLLEIPMGSFTLREIWEDCGGGMEAGKTFKCLQIGGPLGGIFTEESLDVALDFDSIKAAGGLLGSGGIIVMDDSVCGVEMTRHLVSFLMAESCGVCTPCREGLRCIHHVLSRICEGEGTTADMPLLGTLIDTAAQAARCAFGQGLAMPLSGSLRAFREEYEEHIRDHACRAGRCGFGGQPVKKERVAHVD